MKKFFILVLMLTAAISGCSEKKTEPVSRDLFAMDTYMNLKAYGDDSTLSAIDKAAEKIMEFEELFSVTKEKSDIRNINHAEGRRVIVNKETADIIKTSVQIGSQSGGALDVTVYPVLRQWGFTTGEYQIPDIKTLAFLLENVNYRKITVDENSVTVPKDVQIDLGALAKGYTGDAVMNIFRENGIESAIVNLGGNVQTLGKKPDGSMWKVAIRNPFQPDTELGIVQVSDKAVITSGNYERYFIGEDGNSYCHIINPSTGKPAQSGIVSVTIVGEEGLVCDALSTCLFIVGSDKAETIWREREDFEMIFVTDDRRICLTEGLEKLFSPGDMCSDMKVEVIYR